jgi:serine/threonine protein kinase
MVEPTRIHSGATIDRYVVEGRLGEGGMGVVLRVRHQVLGTAHALKVLTLTSRGLQDRLRREGVIQAALAHPNVVRVSDVVDVGDGIGLILEYVDGPSLEDLLRERRPTLAEVDAIATGILAGVAAAHRAGVVHRDLKPANILLARAGDGFVPKVADFGLAKALDGGASRTRTGATFGTPSYMSPEQTRDAKNLGPASDVWSLGAVLYELCTGHKAFDGVDVLETMRSVAAGAYAPPRSLAPELPRRMERAIVAALQVDPARRPRSVEALAALWAGSPGRVDADPVLVGLAWAGLGAGWVVAQSIGIALLLGLALWWAAPRPAPQAVALQELRTAALSAPSR